MEVRLIVIRSTDPKRLAEFYSFLGFEFVYHRHGKGPMHYSAIVGKMVFEIYPLAKNQEVADKNIRLGFALNDLEEALQNLRSAGIDVPAPVETEFGEITVISDFEGRKIELYKSDDI